MQKAADYFYRSFDVFGFNTLTKNNKRNVEQPQRINQMTSYIFYLKNPLTSILYYRLCWLLVNSFTV